MQPFDDHGAVSGVGLFVQKTKVAVDDREKVAEIMGVCVGRIASGPRRHVPWEVDTGAPAEHPCDPSVCSQHGKLHPREAGRDVRRRRQNRKIDDLLAEIRDRTTKNQRVLVTTLTKRMSEDLASYYTEVGVRCRYMHSEIETLERIKLLRDLRKGEYDVLIGINLLREGLDLPEVSLVAILDADKEGFLRSQGSLIQTIGRAARHIEGRAILYADKMTDSMQRAIDETNRRREKQEAYNEENGITPQSIIRPLEMGLAGILKADYADLTDEAEGMPDFVTQQELDTYIGKLESDMREAAKKFEFEKAAKLRDTVKELRTKEFLFS